MDILVKFKL